MPLTSAGETRLRATVLERDHTGHNHDAVRTAIIAARDTTWAANRRVLHAAVTAYTATAPAGLIRAAINPKLPRARRKAQAGLAIATTLHQSGHGAAWIAANAACRHRAWEAGARCGAHQVTDGALPIDTTLPAETAPAGAVFEKRRRRRGILTITIAAAAALLAALIRRRRRNQTAAQPPNQDLDQQIDGLAGDLADLYTAARAATNPDDPDGGVTDADIAQALEDAAGVDAYADLAWGQAFLDGATALYTDAGATQVNWLCCLPGCPTCQDVMANSPYPVDDAPGPQHPNCFPAGTVVSGPEVIGSAVRWYSGEVLDVETVGGRTLTGTPNHPVLTGRGWVPLGELREGDDLVCDGGEEMVSGAGSVRSYPDDEQLPALIEEVARTLGPQSGVVTACVPVAPEDFHGDGAGSDVAVVRSHRFLRRNDGTALAQPLSEAEFVAAGHGLDVLDSTGATAQLVPRHGPSAHGVVGRRGLGGTLLGRHARGGHDFALGLRANRHPALAQSPLDGVGRTAVGAGEFTKRVPSPVAGSQLVDRDLDASGSNRPQEPALAHGVANGSTWDADDPGRLRDRLAGRVHLERLSKFSTREFSGHVYSLSTVGGWYVADGVIVHNCDDWVEPLDPADAGDTAVAA